MRPDRRGEGGVRGRESGCATSAFAGGWAAPRGRRRRRRGRYRLRRCIGPRRASRRHGDNKQECNECKNDSLASSAAGAGRTGVRAPADSASACARRRPTDDIAIIATENEQGEGRSVAAQVPSLSLQNRVSLLCGCDDDAGSKKQLRRGRGPADASRGGAPQGPGDMHEYSEFEDDSWAASAAGAGRTGVRAMMLRA